MTELDNLIKSAERALAWNDWYLSRKPDMNIDAPELLNGIQKDLRQAVGQAKAVEAVAWLHHTVDPNGFVSDMQVSFSNHSILNEISREPLYTTPPSVDALIADAVAKEREACALIADSFVGCEAIASKIRARSGG